ncbi:bet v i allergen [Colletotrichum plurivorum]|uniref:Bet v i allergen n=1 Tax=Colletotrichum plurivorum TaxID=2175906 RepID=A0A8H6KM44_9PEZI|nr:bet v i allergen [Colletotrichum plurivorum]
MSNPEKTTEVVKVVDAPIAEVWAIISAFGSERLWFPGVDNSSLEGFGIGSVRTLKFDHGAVVRERLEVADPETHTIRYLLLDEIPNTTNPRGTLQLTAVGENKTQFSWTGASEWTEPTFKPVLADMLDKMFSGCIDSLAAKLK